MREHSRHPRLSRVSHPLLMHKLTRLRDETTSTERFRRLMREAGALMAYEMTRDLPVTDAVVNTPLEAGVRGVQIASNALVVVPILRAGLGMAEGMIEVMPAARSGQIGLRRKKGTEEIFDYLVSLPAPEERLFLIVDPVIATGITACRALALLKEDIGIPADRLRLCALMAAPDGLKRLAREHGDVPLFIASEEREVNAEGYVLPGLGDAGDRLFGISE